MPSLTIHSIKTVATLVRNFLVDGVVSLVPMRRGEGTAKKPVLLVRLDAIGDFVLWLDAAAALRVKYPPERYRLVLLGNELWTDLALQQPFFDEVIPVNTKRLLPDLRYRLSLWLRLRATRWSIAINPTYSRHFPYDDAAIRVCGAKQRIGFQSDFSNQRRWEMRISNRWYTRLLPATPGPLMELERNAEFVRGLGFPGFRAGLPGLKVTAALPASLAAGSYCVVVPGASLPIKQWPLEKFAELVRRIWNDYGLKVLLCGAPAEQGLGRRLRQMLPETVALEDLIGNTALAEYAAIIKGARLVIANDSSAVHIAAAVGTQSVCIVGGAHFGRFVPYRVERAVTRPLPATVYHRMDCYHCNLNCSRGPMDVSAACLEGVSVDEVWREAQALLYAGEPST